MPAANSLLMLHASLWCRSVGLTSPFLCPQHMCQKHNQQRGRKAAEFLHTASFSPRSGLMLCRLLLYRPVHIRGFSCPPSWIPEASSYGGLGGARPSWPQCAFPVFLFFSRPRSPAHTPYNE